MTLLKEKWRKSDAYRWIGYCFVTFVKKPTFLPAQVVLPAEVQNPPKCSCHRTLARHTNDISSHSFFKKMRQNWTTFEAFDPSLKLTNTACLILKGTFTWDAFLSKVSHHTVLGTVVYNSVKTCRLLWQERPQKSAANNSRMQSSQLG